MSDWTWWRFEGLRGAGPGFAHLYAGEFLRPPLQAACGYVPPTESHKHFLFLRPGPGAPYCSRCERLEAADRLPGEAP